VVVGADVSDGPGLVDEVIAAVLGAKSPAAWREVVHRYGPLQLTQPELEGAILARADALHLLGRSEEAQTVRRWQDEVSRRTAEQRVMDALLSAPDDAAAFAVLDRHPGLASADSVDNALAEVHALLNGRGPYPPDIAREAARRILVAASRMARFLDDDVLRHRCLFEQAMLAMLSGDREAAWRDFGAAAEFWEARGDLFEAGRCASLAGDALRESGRADEALDRYQRAVAMLHDAEDGDLLLGPTYEDIARLLLARHDEDGAFENLELAVRYRNAAGQAPRTVPLLQLMAGLRVRRREIALALEPLEQLVQTLNDHPVDLPAELVELVLACAVPAVLRTQGEAEFLDALQRATDAGLSGIGPTYRTYMDAEQLSVARRWVDLCEQALRLAPDERGQAMFRYLDAVLRVAEADLDRAVEQARDALDYFTAHDALTEMSSLLVLLMQAEAARGRPAAAIGWADKALDRSRDATSRATVLVARAACLSTLGRSSDALADLHEAVDLSRGVDGDLARVNEGAALSALGQAYDAVGDLPAAIGAHRDALRVARSVGHTRGEATELAALGVVLGKLATEPPGRAPLSPADVATLVDAVRQADPTFARDPQQLRMDRVATALLEQAGRLYREIGDNAGRSAVMVNLANLMPENEVHRKIEILTEVVALKDAIGDRLGKAVALANLAAARRAIGEPAAAATAWEQSLAISRDVGFFDSASQSLVGLARLRRAQGDLAGAERDLGESIAMIEAARLQVPLADRYRVGFVRGRGAAYGDLVDLLTERGAYNEAFDVVQQAKSRALLEIAAMTDVQPARTPQGRFAELLDLEAESLATLRAAQGSVATTSRTGGRPPIDLGALSRIYDEMSSYDPDYVSMRRGSPATLAQVRAWLAAQGRPMLLVEYFLSEQHLTVFLLRSEWTDVVGYRKPVATTDVQGWYADFRRQVVRYRNAAGNSWTVAADVLMRPLADHLHSGDLVYLVPHRLLHGLPLHALPTAADPLIVDHPVAYAPTSGLLPLSQNDAKGSGHLDSCAAFGVVFEEEARQVAALFGARAVDRPHLTEDDVERLCQDRDVCHFSCHGYFDELYPLSSGLVLRAVAEDGEPPTNADPVLSARRIMRMRLRSELICLSACETAMSEVGEGDELLGLIRAFLYAGAPSVVASLWKVDAESARDLMVSFYRHLRESYLDSGSIDKPEALRQAQLRVMGREGARSSFHWAPFILVGNWQ
jgi:CHAT domain-containing protein/tetratricopeptide (TPR) repeat protein